jgi:hypothetical protein
MRTNQSLALFIRLIICTFQLVFLVGTMFFSHSKSSNSVFQPAYQQNRTGPLFDTVLKFCHVSKHWDVNFECLKIYSKRLEPKVLQFQVHLNRHQQKKDLGFSKGCWEIIWDRGNNTGAPPYPVLDSVVLSRRLPPLQPPPASPFVRISTNQSLPVT